MHLITGRSLHVLGYMSRRRRDGFRPGNESVSFLFLHTTAMMVKAKLPRVEQLLGGEEWSSVGDSL